MRIHTHHAPHLEEDAWMAIDMDKACEILEGYDLTDEEKESLPILMAGYCRLLDEVDLIGYGDTEAEAIADAKSKGGS